MSPSRRFIRLLFTVGFSASILSSATVAAQTPRVYLEVLSDKGVAIDAPQRWLRMLRDLPLASIRLRQKRQGESFGVERQGGPASLRIRVQAILGADGVLRVPDHRFRLSDQRRMKQWIQQLEAGPAATDKDARLVFGMTGQQLDQVRRRLASPVGMQTQGEPFSKFLEHVRSITTIPIRAGAATRIRPDELVAGELSGVSVGTALAAAVRPMGLALAPAVNADGTLRIDIVDGRTAKEQWPVGWKTDAPERDSLPKLFESLPVEIVDSPLSNTLDAIEKRLGVPMLLDYSVVAAKKIVPEEIKVSFPAKRSFYKRVLDRVLFQAGLQAEVRLDDADHPFIWLTSF